MSSDLQPGQLELGFRPSRYFLAYLLILAALLVVAIASLNHSLGLQAFLLLVAAFGWWRVFCCHYLRQGAGLVQGLSFQQGEWWLRFGGDGAKSEMLVQARLVQSTLWPKFILLGFEVDFKGRQKRRYVMLWPDTAAASLLRQLRVIVNLQGFRVREKS
jgi:hypothetical protein